MHNSFSIQTMSTPSSNTAVVLTVLLYCGACFVVIFFTSFYSELVFSVVAVAAVVAVASVADGASRYPSPTRRSARRAPWR